MKALTIVLLSLFIFSTPVLAEDTVKVGVAAVISGDLAPYGISCVRAVELAADDLNSKGGILGNKIEVLIGDDVCKPEVAVNAATKLVSDGVQMVVGHMCSGATIAANKIYQDAGLLVISPSATSDSLTLSGEHKNFFRTISYDSAQAELMTTFVKNNLKAKTVALIHDKSDYGKGQMDLAKNFFEKMGGIEIVLYDGVSTGAFDYSAIVQRIKKSKAEVTMWGGYSSDGSKLVTQIRKKKVKTIFFGGDGIYGSEFVALGGKHSEGTYATGSNKVSTNALHIELTDRYLKKYSENPGTYFYNAYAGLQALANAAEKAGSLDFDKMKTALYENTVESPLGPIGFNKNGDIIGAGFTVYKVQKGKYVQVD